MLGSFDKNSVLILISLTQIRAGPPGTTKKEARGAYFEAFEQLMKDAQKSIEKRYEAVYQRLQSQQGKDEFFSIGKELYYDWRPVDMKHSTCMYKGPESGWRN